MNKDVLQYPLGGRLMGSNWFKYIRNDLRPIQGGMREDLRNTNPKFN